MPYTLDFFSDFRSFLTGTRLVVIKQKWVWWKCFEVYTFFQFGSWLDLISSDILCLAGVFSCCLVLFFRREWWWKITNSIDRIKCRAGERVGILRAVFQSKIVAIFQVLMGMMNSWRFFWFSFSRFDFVVVWRMIEWENWSKSILIEEFEGNSFCFHFFCSKFSFKMY